MNHNNPATNNDGIRVLAGLSACEIKEEDLAGRSEKLEEQLQTRGQVIYLYE